VFNKNADVAASRPLPADAPSKLQHNAMSFRVPRKNGNVLPCDKVDKPECPLEKS
jgi:hypothetical protein